ncbi:MAG: MATE family efflux transporter [Chitinophagaceae bacterium]
MTVNNPYQDLRIGISNRQILRIALPISMALLVPQINFVVNNVFLSGLGETELGTAGITGVFYLIFALAGNGLNSGLQGLLARRAGENRRDDIGRIFMQGLWIALFYAAGAVLITFIPGPALLTASIRSDTVYREAVGFLQIRVWGVLFLYFFQMCNALLVATNCSRYMKYGFWIQAAVNILLDYALIYGHWGLPRLGFNGAAYASVISELAGLLVVFGILVGKKFHLQFHLFRHRRFDPALSGMVFRQSSPLVAQFLLSILAWMLFYILIEHQGERPLAISNTMRNVYGLIGIFTWAFASTANAMVSNIIGQGKKEQVIGLIHRIMKLSLAFTFVLCLAVNIFPEFWLRIYGRDRSFTEEAIPVIRIVSAGIMLMSVATVWLNAVTGTGNTRVNLLIEIVAIGVYTIYVYMVLHILRLGLVWAWASELIYWGLLFLLSYLYLRSGRWKKKVI